MLTWNGTIKGLVVEAWLRFRAVTSAHSASKGSPDFVLIAAESTLIARACNMGGLRRGVIGGGAGACDVKLPNHCSGFGRFVVFGTS